MRVGRCAVAVFIAVVVAALISSCGTSKTTGYRADQVIGIEMHAVPETAPTLIEATTPRANLPLGAIARFPFSRIRQAIPSVLPLNAAQQSCTGGALITVVLLHHRLVKYGPCTFPPGIKALESAMQKAAKQSQG
jgi:hypothetical protein